MSLYVHPGCAALQYLIVYAVGLSLLLLHTLQGHVPVLQHLLALVIFHLLHSLHLLEIQNHVHTVIIRNVHEALHLIHDDISCIALHI